MDKSLTNFELPENAIKSDSEHGSDKSENNLEIVSLDTDQSSTNGNGSNRSEEDFDNNLPETVTLLRHAPTGAKLYLVGTAHFSKESQDDVAKIIQNVVPNCVVLELCASRTNMLTMDEKTVLEEAKNIDIQKVISNIRTSGLYNGLMYVLLLNLSAHITKELGMAPGGEFRVAFTEAQRVPHCEIMLGDRPINITLQRALARLTWCQTVRLAWHLLTSKDPISTEDIEKCKKRDMLEQLLSELSGEYPAFREVFLDERDIFLTNSLQLAIYNQCKKLREGGDEPPIRVVGVVGIGHVPGITELWNADLKGMITPIMQIPPPSLTSKVIRIGIRVSLITLGGYVVYRCVPVPSTLKQNALFVVNKFIDSVKGGVNHFKYTVVV